MFARLFYAAIALIIAAPALAGAGPSVQIPEPGDAALFVIAVIGLIVGRQASRRAPPRDE